MRAMTAEALSNHCLFHLSREGFFCTGMLYERISRKVSVAYPRERSQSIHREEWFSKFYTSRLFSLLPAFLSASPFVFFTSTIETKTIIAQRLKTGIVVAYFRHKKKHFF